MSLLPQVKQELITAAQRPTRAKRATRRLAAVIIAAVAALLITAPPSVARLPASIAVVSAYASR